MRTFISHTVVVLLLTISGLDTDGQRTAEAGVIGEGRAGKLAPRFVRLDASLNRLAAADLQLSEVEGLGVRARGSRVQMVAVAEANRAAGVEGWLASRGATHVVAAGNLVQAFVDVSLLPSLAEHDDIVYVRRPRYLPTPLTHRVRSGVKLKAATTEGLAPMNADSWHATGVMGQGIRVAIIDLGFMGYGALLGSDLPDVERVSTAAIGGAVFDASEHGTACAEIVFDLVPDLERMVLLAVATDVDVASAIAAAQEDGIDVISMSLGWLPWGPNDGTGVIADAIDSFVAAGGVVAVSAGDGRLTHWQGTWNDTNGDDYLDFANGEAQNYLTVEGGPGLWWVPAGTEISVAMIWNQWVAPDTDLDLYLYRWSGTGDPYPIDMSEDYQTGVLGELPIEQLTYVVPTGLEGYFGFGVMYWSGPLDVEIEIVVRPHLNPLEDNIPEGSLLVPADTMAAIAVAALDVAAPHELEASSSMGPANGPGGSLSGGTVKPDISGFANVSTATYGIGAFPGTSAACPHVAGAAALVWSGHPEWNNGQIRDYLDTNAVDMGLPGKDNDYGQGRLHLGDPPTSSCDPPVTPTGLSSTDSEPPSGVTYEISWSVVAEAVSYQLQEATDPSFTDASTVTVTSTSQSYIHAVSTDTVYYYRVQARRDCGALSEWSATVSVTVAAGTMMCDAPASPSHLQSSAANPVSSESYVLSWGEVADADSYEIQEATDVSFSGASSVTITGNSKTFSHAISSDTTFYYRVRARRDCGSESPWTGTVEVTVMADTGCATPGIPTNLRSSLRAPYPDEPYTLSWDVVDGADIYELREADNPEFDASFAFYTYSPAKNLSHTVDEPTPYYYKVRARRDCGSRSDWSPVVEVVVAPAGDPETWFYLVPGVAHAPGSNDTRWRSSLAVFNPGERPADLDITFRTELGSTVEWTVVSPRATLEWMDVVPELFGENGSRAGAVEVVSSRRVIVTARTFNLSETGTFGQYLPGCRVEDALEYDGTGYLPQIKGGGGFRTNIGLVNFGGSACTVVVTLHDELGRQVGSPLEVTVEPGAWKQENDVFAAARAGSCRVGHAMLDVQTPGCSVWAYASVVDQATGDPTTIPLFVD